MDANAAAAAAAGETTGGVDVAVDICRKLSNYMLYFLVTHHSMLPIIGVSEVTLDIVLDEGFLAENGGKDAILRRASEGFEDRWEVPEPQPCKETLEEIKRMWVCLLLYIAGQSRPEMHAPQLGKGGELLTFIWLLMAHNRLGDSDRRIEFIDVFPERLMQLSSEYDSP